MTTRKSRYPTVRWQRRMAALPSLLLSLVLLLTTAHFASAQGDAPTGDAPASGAYRVNPSRSDIYAVTHRAGVLGFLGHEHAVLATEWSADICYRPDDVGGSSVRVTVPTAMLSIDTERGRELADLGAGPDSDTVADLQEKMLRPEWLAADEHPEIGFVSRSVSRQDASTLLVNGPLSIRGRQSRVEAQLEVSQVTGGLRFQGNFVIGHGEFGMEPETVAGVVSVAEQIDVFIDVVASPLGRDCG